ncbi:MAG: hypothetical protein FWD73_07655 [Polyangiaceae bacterium]|nr:hypothetical protein [Polyangiaceae bacterium]
MLGFQIEERFEGSYYLLSDPFVDRIVSLSMRVSVDGVRRALRERVATVNGTIFAEGLAEGGGEGSALSGTLRFRLFDEKRIPYDLFFNADDGCTYRLRGQRDFFIHDAARSLTVLPASLYDTKGDEMGRAVLRFDPKIELVPTLKSFRPRLRMRFLGSPPHATAKLD